MNTLSKNSVKFLAKNPTYIGTTLGCKFYEHPTRGDESPLIMISAEGKLSTSEFWELPSVDELLDQQNVNCL